MFAAQKRDIGVDGFYSIITVNNHTLRCIVFLDYMFLPFIPLTVNVLAGGRQTAKLLQL